MPYWNWFDPDVVAWQAQCGLTPEFLKDLQELRRVVEPAAVRLAAERATTQDIAQIEAAYAGMKKAVEEGGDYVTHDMRFHQGLLQASHNRMLVQMSKALNALLRTSFEISARIKDGPKNSLPLAARGQLRRRVDVTGCATGHMPPHKPPHNRGHFDEAFHRLDEAIATAARVLPGYLGEESWEDTRNGLVSNVYYWESLAA
eukprot:gene32742-40412_t